MYSLRIDGIPALSPMLREWLDTATLVAVTTVTNADGFDGVPRTIRRAVLWVCRVNGEKRGIIVYRTAGRVLVARFVDDEQEVDRG